MPRPQSPEIRTALIERAAALLARREPVTLRALVDGVGVSTMAVYTYFDGMPGLWGAVRQEGFVRLAERLESVEHRRDPVRHLAALGVSYVDNAVANPHLYRVMFDASWDLPDPEAAGRRSNPWSWAPAAPRTSAGSGPTSSPTTSRCASGPMDMA